MSALTTVALLLLAGCGTTPRTAAPIDAAGVAGCYVLSFGAWSAPASEEIHRTIPDTVRLDTIIGVERFERDLYTLRPRAATSRTSYANWRFTPPHTVTMAWTTGYTLVRITAAATADGIEGTAQAGSDAMGPESRYPTAAVRGVRTPCPAHLRQ